MAKTRFADHPLSVEIDKLARSSDHQALAAWAAECAERVLPLFEIEFPEDDRPRVAILKLREWARIGEFHMKDVRTASLNAHTAARQAPDGSAAQFAARACGQALATAHVKTHSIAAAWYAAKAAWAEEDNRCSIQAEREWQHHRLIELTRSI